MNKLIFLGGTVGNNNWRDEFIDSLLNEGIKNNQIFNPVVKDWNEESRNKEEIAKKNATHFLFYLGNPNQEGSQLSAYSMVEATMALFDNPDTTAVIFDDTDIIGHSLKSFKQTEKVLKERFPNANIFSSAKEALSWLKLEFSIDFN